MAPPMRNPILTLIAAIAVLPATFTLAAQPDDTTQSAIWLLQKTTLIHADGGQNVLLRALRQLKDPALKPLYSDLVQKRHPVLKIHGILGLGEISANHRIDIALVADLKETGAQVQAVESALEADLLDNAQCKQLIAWPGKEMMAVRLIAATRLVRDGQLEDRKILDDAIAVPDNLAVNAMGALLKLQLGDAKAIEVLDKIGASEKPEKDAVRALILQAAAHNKFDKLGPWALKIAMEPKVNTQLALGALRTAVMFKAPGASAAWLQRFDASTGLADKIRVAMIAVDLHDKIEPTAFDRLSLENDPLMLQMSRTGKALAAGGPAVEEVLKLVEQDNLLTSRWVLDYATTRKTIDEAKPILVGLILAVENGANNDRSRGVRTENAVLAAQHLSEKLPDAKALFAELAPQVPALTQESMLMGLIRSNYEHPEQQIDGITSWKGDTAPSLVLLLSAKKGVKLTADQLDRLGLIVRGGGGLQEPLRVQGAWAYLKQTHQEQVALASLLGK